MLLKSLEIQGFKTFPEKTLLSFDKGITAVVGPNGSGKSNISDAIRWTLGEQSIKTLRCAKMEDIIFSGSEKRKPRGFAEVVLNFDNRDRTLVIDEDDVSVTRRYYRSGESEYLINGNMVRLKDIHELFMDTGLGRDGYSMISQGKIDRIVSSRPEDRREIFEEAAGISKYKYRKSEAERKLLQAEENLIRLKDILKELSERIGPLKEQSEKAKTYLELANKKKALEIGTWLFSLDESSKILEAQNTKLEISRDHYNEIESAIDCMLKETEEIGEKINKHSSNIDAIKREININEESLNAKVNEVSVLKNDILHNNENIKRIESEMEVISKSEVNVNEEITKRKDNVEKLKKVLFEKQIDLEQYNQIIDKLSKEADKSSKCVEDISLNLIERNKHISFAKANIEACEANLKDLIVKKVTINEEISTLEANLESKSQDAILYFNKTNEIKNALADKAASLNILEDKLIKKKKENDNFKELSGKLTLDAEEQFRKVRLLQDLERNFDGFSGSVKFIMKQTQKGKLDNICGPVSSIITVPNEYVVAVETALGYSMQSVVVQTNYAAKKAIAFLKEKGAGRATFLPVETINGNLLDVSEVKRCKGFVELCNRLCIYDQKYSGILHYLLGRTVVVNNLDNATEIAKKFSYKFKIVTLDGQIVNAGGSLTGGSRVKSAGILSRTTEIEKSKEMANSLYSKAENIKAILKASLMEEQKLSDEIIIVKNDISNISDKYSKYFEIFTRCSLEKDSLNKQLKSLIGEKNAVYSKIENLNLSRDKYLKTLEEEKIKIQEFECSLTEMTKCKEKLLSQKEELSSKIHEVNMEVLSLKKDVSSMNSEIESILSRKFESGKKCESLKSQIDQFSLKNIGIKDKVNLIEDEIVLIKERNTKKVELINTLNDARLNFEKNITELRKKERERISERENVALEVARLEERKDSLQIEYDKIIAKLWDEYELTRREALEAYDKLENIQKAKIELSNIKNKIKSLGTVNVAAIDEYKVVFERYDFMNGQVLDAEKSKKELYNLINDLTDQMKTLFTKRFVKISEGFSEIFKELFDGGKATLKLTQPDDILRSGIEIFVQPPGKIVTHLESLSGGEKALIAITLYFSIMKVSPAPFCVLDEIEAALDEVNVDRFAAYLRKMNKSTQFIVISHRRGTMEEADVLYGVTMQQEGISKVLELKTYELSDDFVER